MSRLRILLVALTIAGLTACSQTTAGDSYDLVEFAVEGPNELDPGTQSLKVTNSGHFAHTLVITDDNGSVVGTTPLIDPGDATELGLDLEAGHVYSFTCRIVVQTPDGELVDHYEEGMAKNVQVRG